MNPWSEAVITHFEVLRLPKAKENLGHETWCLLKFKEQGAPVIGTVVPRLDHDNYEFDRYQDELTFDEVLRWRPWCPDCDNLGYVYEGGISMNPEIDNRVPCPNGCPEEDL